MITRSYESLIDKYKSNYSKEEFEFVISLFPISKISEVIKNNEKKFRGYYNGFRPDKLPLKKLQEIYYKAIYNANNMMLANHVEHMIVNQIQKIDKIISQQIGSVKLVRKKIEENDMDCFVKLTSLLLDHKFNEAYKIFIYFKMVNLNLTEIQKEYLNNDLNEVIQFKKNKEEITNEVKQIFELKIQELKDQYENEIKNNKNQIKILERFIEDSKLKFEEELSLKDREFKQSELEFSKRLEKATRDSSKDKERINQLKNEVEELREEKDNYEKSITNLETIVKMKYDEYCVTVEEKWLENNNELVLMKEELKATLDNLLSTKESLLLEITSLNNQRFDLEDMITLLGDEGRGIVSKIKNFLEKIGVGEETTKHESNLRIVTSQNSKIEVEIINDKSFFIDDLSDNLQICGIRSEFSNDLAHYIYGSIVNKMSLLLVGYNTRKIADALSYIVSGTGAEIISLPLGFNNCNKLINAVNNSTSKVVLIENAVTNISEAVYLPLLKENNAHILLFSMDSSEHISLLPKSLMDYMLFIDLDSIIDYTKDSSELIKSQIDFAIFNVLTDVDGIRANFRRTNSLNKIYSLSKVARIKLAEVMNVIDQLNSDNGLYDILMFTMNMMCKNSGNSMELMQYIEEQEFSPLLLKMLRSAIEENLDE